jgi:hypothetical protein
LGGFLLHLAIGSVYIWGNISIYVTSYLRHYDETVTYETTFIVLPIHIMSSNMTILVGSILCTKYSPKLAIFVGGTIFLLGVFLSSF